MYSYDRTASYSKMALSVGETFENESWRVHRFATSIKVTHLVNAGKRSKSCQVFTVVGDLAGESMSMEFVLLAKRGVDIGRMEKSMQEAEEIGSHVSRSLLKGVDVKPGNFQKLVVRGLHITVEADYDSYSIKNIDDEDNEPTCIAQGKRSVFLFYRWVKENSQDLQRMTLQEAMKAMDSAGIQYHNYCAVD